MKLLILTGMSGSGKHTAFKVLEDIGYHCVDNLPVALLKDFIELAARKGEEMSRVAVGIDIRNGDSISELQDILDELESDGKGFDILFMDADDEVILRRYKETRRTPPHSNGERIEETLKKERKIMHFLKERATYVIDTTHLLTRDLREEMSKIFTDNAEYKSLFVTVLSFGFKYGIPTDADLVFDVRFLPNPYYIEELRPLTGNDEKIRSFVLRDDTGKQFVEKMTDLIGFLIPQYISEGKNQLVICFGCTGGKHRSVTMANEIYEKLCEYKDIGVRIEHRDINIKK
ncbi:MAG: RNase adapter RapZ [Lachnospiraceae bacterium]|nr:RNase adapter RapZ [Lachnospiraceae bacterium]